MSKGKEYTCAGCGIVFTGAWSHKEAMSESKELFGDMPQDSLAVICDDCFKEMGLDENLQTVRDETSK